MNAHTYTYKHTHTQPTNQPTIHPSCDGVALLVADRTFASLPAVADRLLFQGAGAALRFFTGVCCYVFVLCTYILFIYVCVPIRPLPTACCFKGRAPRCGSSQVDCGC